MSDKMQPIPFEKLIHWIFTEYQKQGSIFGIPKMQFFRKRNSSFFSLFGEKMETPLGPAAGPHTQLAQNIVSAYLTGGRFFELKTVQKLDRLEIEKPCIDVEDEGYNVEWSQELTLDQSYDEYLKAWFLLHFLKDILNLSGRDTRGFIFNMSVGYDLAGIQTRRMDRFIEELKDASGNKLFNQYQEFLQNALHSAPFYELLKEAFNLGEDKFAAALQQIDAISPFISNSVTLSTMHGCPPEEIEAICKYLISEKGLHTFVKLNPTLLGFETVRDILTNLGYHYIALDRGAFERDLQFPDAVPMLQRLQKFAASHERIFGVKLSNTLGMRNHKKTLPGEEMFMSGRALFPLTINLAHKLATEFNGEIKISYSGGASQYNVRQIFETGIFPVTMATDLLKPGGYGRLREMARLVEDNLPEIEPESGKINLERLRKLASAALSDREYRKDRREIGSIKIPKPLSKFDCYLAPCQEACPIHQDVAEYVHLVSEGKFTEAFEVIVERNPLPHITGWICDHQCMFHCTRWDYDDPVLIRDLKKAAAEKGYNAYLEQFERNGLFPKAKNADSRLRGNDTLKPGNAGVAVIGAGPAGLSAGYFLAKAGFQVTVFDRAEKAGGTVQNLIPDFRLPQEAIDRDIDFVKRQGVKFQLNWKEKLSVGELKARGFKYVFIGIGAGKSNRLQLSGDNKNILDAIGFLWDFHHRDRFELGKTVAIIGGGNSAMDSARAAKRCPGVEKVYIIYRRTREFMPADKEEFYAALNDGIEFRELLLPVDFSGPILKCQKMALGEIDFDGRRKVIPLPGEFVEFEADTVISAIGEHVDSVILRENGIRLDANGKVMADPRTNQTELENVYIGGDALRGPSTVVESIADGKKAAEAIIEKETGAAPIEPDFREKFDNRQRIAEIEQKKSVFLFTNPNDPPQEASRCLECNLLCNKCVDVCPNRANVAIATPNDDFKNQFQILHLDGLCNECGNCETFCPYTGSPYRDKITLFWNEKDFDDSRNDGFYLVNFLEESDIEFKVRFKLNTGSVHFDRQGTFLATSLPVETLDIEFDRLKKMLQIVLLNYRHYFIS